MPHTLGKRGKKIYPGDIRHGTRWASEKERALAGWALRTLENERLRVILVPAPRKSFSSHKIRRVESHNPAWYRKFGKDYWRSRRSFQLKRLRVEGALERVRDVGIVRRNGYEVRILEFLQDWMKEEASPR